MTNKPTLYLDGLRDTLMATECHPGLGMKASQPPRQAHENCLSWPYKSYI